MVREGDWSNAMSSYLEICERLYADWLRGRATFRSAAASRAFSAEHAPEPYLVFGEGEPRAIWATTNPGEGFDYQKRPDVCSTSIFRETPTYAEAARRLGGHYGAPDAPIHSAARANIRSMLRLSRLFGARSVLQVETFPWHSATLPDKTRLEVMLCREEPAYAEYKRELNKLIAAHRLVLAWAAGVPGRGRGSGMDLKATMIGLDLARAKMLPLEGRSAVSQALFWSREGGRFRGLFVTQGSATLPGAGLNREGADKDALITAATT